MILADRNLRAALEEGSLIVTPLATDAIRPASIDLRLGPLLTIPDPNSTDGWRVHDLRESPYRLYPSGFLLGHTLEWVEIPPDLAGILAGKSSRAREGLIVESAGYVDSGWKGELTLEIGTLHPDGNWLMVGMLIAQIRLEQLLSPCEKPYGSDATSRYQGSRGPVASRGVVGRAS